MTRSRCIALLVMAALAVSALFATKGSADAHTGVFLHTTVASGGHHAIPEGASVEVLCQLTGDAARFRVTYQGRSVVVPAAHTDHPGTKPVPGVPTCGGAGPAPVVQPAAPVRPGAAQARETVKPV